MAVVIMMAMMVVVVVVAVGVPELRVRHMAGGPADSVDSTAAC